MKRMKKLLAVLLTAACLASLLVVPPAAAASTISTFSDVSDPTVGTAVEVLRTMGVVDGVPGGGYNPSGTLTRAEFCKLLVLTMNRGDDVDAYATKTIFPDVASTYWARGYINLAASIDVGGSTDSEGNPTGGSRLIMGVGDGTFAPNRTITYAEAVTILLRVLGYTSAANTNWPSGAISTANSSGLADNLTGLSASSSISRGQAAILFYNMLLTPTYNSTSIYAASLGSVVENTLLLSCNTEADDGSEGAIAINGSGSVRKIKAAANNPASFFQGRYGTAVLNKDGLFLTFLPERNATSRTITTSKATAGTTNVITAADGSRITVSPSTTVWYNGTQKTYSEIYGSLNRAGVTVTIYYTAAGAIDYLYVGGITASTSGNAMVAKDPISGNPFATLTGGASGYTILKNGVRASVSDIRQYDVGVFDASANTLYVTDFRLTGVYQSASPNTAAPAKITMFNTEFEVLESAIDDLNDFKVGSSITLLLTADGKVAGAVNTSQARSTAVGVVTADSSGSSVKVDLLGAPTGLLQVSGTISGKAEDYRGSLVNVTAGSGNTIYLSKLISNGTTSSLNVANKTIGTAALAENISIYERVGDSAITAITLADLTVDTVDASKIVYLRRNYAGKVDLLVLDDVTGDCYTYGIASTDTKTSPGLGDSDMSYSNMLTTVTNRDGSLTTIGSTNFRDGQFIGLAASLASLDGSPRIAGSVELKSVKNVSLSNFNTQTNIFFSGSLELPIAANVQCYNAQTKTWFNSLDECLSYSNNLTVYYDRNPNEGGKVRVVVAN